jgi:uncharacterized protein
MSCGSLQTRGKLAMSNADIRGRFIWHELMTTDLAGAESFYSKVVPWKTQPSGMPSYTLWMSGKTRIAGLMALPEGDASGTPPHWIIYVGTSEVDATAEAAKKLGGKVLKEAADIPNVGRFAVLADPQGAAFAVFTPASGSEDGGPAGGGPGDFTWHELATTDIDAAMHFYSELFGWSKGATHDMGAMGIYQIVSHGEQDVGGVFKARDASVPPSWLSYARVASSEKAAAAVKAGGGRILNGPMEVPGGSWIVQLLDPQGGAFAVVEAPKAAAAPAEKKAAASKPAKPAAAKKPAAPAAKSAAVKPGAKKKAAAKASGKKPVAKSTSKKTAVKKTAVKKTAVKKSAKKRVVPAAKKSTSAKRGPAVKKSAKGGKKAAKTKTKKRR